ncbi:MAG: hypothetical protein IJJ33_11765 [Victivallales bacterium]|nr:hypothetical protein [Victivallales bacterium]
MRTNSRHLSILLFIALLFAGGLVTAQSALDAVVHRRGRALFQTDQKALLRALKLEKLTWNTKDHTQIRYSREFSDEMFLFGECLITEAVFQFADKRRLSAIDVSIYNRGDCGLWPRRQFDSAVKSLTETLTRLTGDRQPQKSNKSLQNNRIQQLLWRTAGYDAALRWAASKNETEFIGIQFARHGDIQSLSQDIRAEVNTASLASRVQKEVDGARWLNVPMVNQGRKGYCVDAVVERFMRYYNSSIDQHIIAQLADSDPFYGTNLNAAISALEKNSNKLRIRTKRLYDNENFRTVAGLRDFAKEYNRFAVKNKAVTLEVRQVLGSINVSEFLRPLKMRPLIQLRERQRPGPKKFFVKVQESIDRGYPLFWSVLMLDEKDVVSQTSFHARIINGYNRKTDEVIYTDSWGPGFERRSMPVERAWAITDTLLAITPR